MPAKKSHATPATLALEKAGLPFSTLTFDHDPANHHFGEEAAEALHHEGIDAAQIAKTLLVESDKGLAVAVLPVTHQLNLKAMAAALRVKKATMCDPSVAERVTGYVVGGISPIGQKKRLPTVVESSLSSQNEVLVSGGKRGFDLVLSPEVLAQATGAVFAPIARRA
ncbi:MULTISPECIES: Cys-tRNA(Pro) deacylase [unclassified Corynebacterium]|uniref:Cys-tRNA(Pro) deacylase n=1 Tax=unclassified Corynebacterium TaxID=2624378 RepID=UPI0029CAA066|nr:MULTISPECIES: Cys-tRNA(Pro) deacylase [unclassified Corynebacterium]WPF66231.1 Cys-tRNA(Pro) deacylase [Corynebacterium sp. 22KM0430]WPF68721.1 Cys-tRNA(Pro) deacylase [Corynebacterium sp. 21KM1197]